MMRRTRLLVIFNAALCHIGAIELPRPRGIGPEC